MSIEAHVIKGNIVTPDGVLYGGHVIVLGEIIAKVHASDVPVPTAEELQQMLKGTPNEGKNLVVSMHESAFVVPGFVDIHNHGVGGCDEVCDHWAYPEFSQKHLAKSGTLSTLASVIFSSTRPEATRKVIDTIETRVGSYFDDCCVIEGIHAEGPIIQDVGGLPPTETEMSLESFKQLCSVMPSMKIMTISPSKEVNRGFDRLQHLLDIGVRPSIGHDRIATPEAIIGAMKLRPKDSTSTNAPRLHSTHIFNVMSFHHRNPSLINFLMCDRLPAGKKYAGCKPPSVEIIADLIHVHPVAIQSLLSARKVEDVAIISDCISVYAPGRHLKYNGRGITVKAEGGCYLTDSHGRPTKTLAGSTVTLADQFFTLITHFGIDVASACKLLATSPATIARIEDRVGSLREGLKANILLINGEMNTISRRMIYGRWISGEPYRMLKPSVSHL